jgi:alkylation response protein AidB-like acyl-CoA dehydrogenase
MDFRPTDGQRLLQTAARDFLARHCPLEAPPGGEPLHQDRGALWSKLGELGWTGLLVPGDLGGSDGTILDVVLLAEEMGRAGLVSPYVASAVVATSLLLGSGTTARKRAVADMALGRRICALAVLEDSGELEPGAMALRGEIGGALDGKKLLVADADLADDLIVAARGSAGVTLFHVERTRPGIALLPMPSMAGERLFEVTFDNVSLSGRDVLGKEGAGWDALGPALRLGALAKSAEMVGAAQRILDLAVEYAKTRVQSGRPIGAFQAIQHACADLARGVESARPLVLHAAWKAQEGLPCETDVAMAKSYAGDACLAVARKAHQVFGAIGYCDEHPLHRLHKQIIAARLAYGDTRHHAETIARAIGLVSP